MAPVMAWMSMFDPGDKSAHVSGKEKMCLCRYRHYGVSSVYRTIVWLVASSTHQMMYSYILYIAISWVIAIACTVVKEQQSPVQLCNTNTNGKNLPLRLDVWRFVSSIVP